MANYATNLFFCSTENENDLEKVEKFWMRSSSTAIWSAVKTM